MELILILVVVSLVIPWINFIRISMLAKKLEKLLKNVEARSNISTEESKQSVSESQSLAAPKNQSPEIWQTDETAEPVFQNWKWPQLDWDLSIAPRLPVWIASIAFMFAGFYMMKYSIEQDLLSPQIRVLFGYAFGACLLVAALDLIRFF